MTLRPLIILLVVTLACIDAAAQAPKQFLISPTLAKPVTGAVDTPAGDATSANARARTAQPSDKANGPAATANAEVPKTTNAQFRLERLSIANGAELLTIFGRLDGLRA